MDKKAIYQAITDRIVASLESGETPVWHKPWKQSGGLPVNLRSGRPYRGVNILLLLIEGYGDPRWGTYNAIKAAGGQVRKGEKGTSVILWKPTKRKGVDENGAAKEEGYLLLRSFTVFNALQADGLPALPGEEEREFTPIETAEAIVNEYVWSEDHSGRGPRLNQGFAALYNMRRDVVEMPVPQSFVNDESYYATVFHELVHSSGHESRLARLEPALFGSDPYAREELVAEMGSAFLSGVAGLESAGGDQSAGYIGHWIERFKDDPTMIPMAAAQAQKAVDFILDTKFESETVVDEEPVANQDGRVRVGSKLESSAFAALIDAAIAR